MRVRKVLETKVVLPPGTYGQVTFKECFPYIELPTQTLFSILMLTVPLVCSGTCRNLALEALLAIAESRGLK
jgi:hypothetical protein